MNPICPSPRVRLRRKSERPLPGTPLAASRVRRPQAAAVLLARLPASGHAALTLLPRCLARLLLETPSRHRGVDRVWWHLPVAPMGRSRRAPTLRCARAACRPGTCPSLPALALPLPAMRRFASCLRLTLTPACARLSKQREPPGALLPCRPPRGPPGDRSPSALPRCRPRRRASPRPPHCPPLRRCPPWYLPLLPWFHLPGARCPWLFRSLPSRLVAIKGASTCACPRRPPRRLAFCLARPPMQVGLLHPPEQPSALFHRRLMSIPVVVEFVSGVRLHPSRRPARRPCMFWPWWSA